MKFIGIQSQPLGCRFIRLPSPAFRWPDTCGNSGLDAHYGQSANVSEPIGGGRHVSYITEGIWDVESVNQELGGGW